MSNKPCEIYYCRNGQSVYVRDNARDAQSIDVFYCGMWHQRPRTVIGKTLFPVHPALVGAGKVITLAALTPDRALRICVGATQPNDPSVIPLSEQSTLAQALMGHKAGHVGNIPRPDGSYFHFQICTIEPPF